MKERLARRLCTSLYPNKDPDVLWKHYVPEAIAVLEEMRNPTDGMVEEMQYAMWPSGELIYDDNFSNGHEQFRTGFQAMIQSAIEDK